MSTPDLMTIREYTAMALMGSFVMSMVALIVWAVKKTITKALTGFDTVSAAIKTTNDAIWSLKDAVEQNTVQLQEHRKESTAYVERLSRELEDKK